MKDSLPQRAYDELADSYARLVDTKPHNAYYDRPALQSLLGALSGAEVLEAGCGTGVYTEWLVARGARVLGVDANENMLRHARARNPGSASFVQANLEEPLDLPDASFDGILSALTITYLRDLGAVFTEFSRVLRPGGWFVFSTEHPFFSYRFNHIEDYYGTKEVSCTWKGFDRPVEMKSYYHSLGTITEALARSGFLVERMIEPLPVDAFREADPGGYAKILAFPLFIFVRAVKRP
jgi:SAM-dependent methyltransferase